MKPLLWITTALKFPAEIAPRILLSKRRRSIGIKKGNKDIAIRAEVREGSVLFVLLQHDWPGNVRELENVISSAAITPIPMSSISPTCPSTLQKSQRPSAALEENWRPLPLDEVRSVHIRRVLEMCNGNRVRAAQVLGIGRTSLHRFLKRTTKQSAAAKGAA